MTAAKAVNLALAPVRGLIWSYEKLANMVIPALADRFKGREDKVVPPSPVVAVPVYEALRLTGGEPELRELYLNLLASAMDADKISRAHPAFAEVIRQMSPDEARILRVVAQNREFFSVGMNRIECNVERAGKHYTYQGDGFVTPDPECSCPQFTASYVNNLSRLGLIEYEQNTSTDPIKKGDETKYALSDRLTAELRSILAACGVLSARIVGGHITLTDFGRHFVSACMTVSAPNSP